MRKSEVLPPIPLRVPFVFKTKLSLTQLLFHYAGYMGFEPLFSTVTEWHLHQADS